MTLSTLTRGLVVGAAGMALLCAAPALAGPIDWTHWTTFTTGATTGTAAGTAGGVGVSYSGELENLFANYPSWTPALSYVGGTVGNAPLPSDGIIQLFGAQLDPNGAPLVDTITFSKPVTNPVIAIWSLGQGGSAASFVFPGNEPVTIEAGGPSAEYGGGSITLSGNTISGLEGNGTIQLTGTFTSISWTTPQFENWYGFAVGVVPEPATWALMLAGFAGLGMALRSRRMRFARA
ncbi:MAG TPA: PEPxxWA-CTERM sorting domain-containing protein [Caulobacteraceae bacterium]